MSAADDEVVLTGGGRTRVIRRGAVVHRATGPWAPSVHAVLRHLERKGFAGAPRVVGDGFDEEGRETLSFIDGIFVHPGPWPSDDAFWALGDLLRRLHDALADFEVPAMAAWRPWFGRSIPGSQPIIGHGDVAPWNIVARDGLPVALIDWEVAGPVDRLVELAQACWLNAQWHDDDVAAMAGLDSPQARARQARLMLDGYRLGAPSRAALFDTMVAFAVHDAAAQAIEAGVTPDATEAGPLWGITWRTRAASWMLRHRSVLEAALR